MVTKHDGVEIIEDADDAWEQWEDTVTDFADTEPMAIHEGSLTPLTAVTDEYQIDVWASTDVTPFN